MTVDLKEKPASELEAIEEKLENRDTVIGGIAVFSLLGMLVLAITLVALAVDLGAGGDVPPANVEPTAEVNAGEGSGHGDHEGTAAEASAVDAADVKYEEYRWVDPTLPAVPPGAVKEFTVDVYEHVTKVSDDAAPMRVWSFGVNGKLYRGTGVSAPIVVEQGDRVHMILRNGSSRKMNVRMPHSIDFHSSEVAPNVAFATIPPGETHEFSFVAKHPGVFMYHCATQPVLHHTAAGMVGMMVVKPKNLAPADRELWINQQEFYLGEPGADADYAKAQEAKPDVIAFNGYANQYVDHRPIEVRRGEKIRLYVLNSGPSVWSAFHVIGTVFDRAVTDNGVARHVQTVNLAPSQGGYVEFTLDQEGSYPFVTHSFADMEKGALGSLVTERGPKDGGGH